MLSFIIYEYAKHMTAENHTLRSTPELGECNEMNPATNISQAKVILICPMDEEASPYFAKASYVEEIPVPFQGTKAAFVIYNDFPLVLVTCGIGLVSAAMSAQWALGSIPTFRPEVVICSGSAGGIGKEVRVGTVAVATSLAYGNADATAFGYELGQVPRQPPTFVGSLRIANASQRIAQNISSAESVESVERTQGWNIEVGQILSGDCFVDSKLVAKYREDFPQALTTDMESCAIAQVCYSHNIEFTAVRGVSDLCGDNASDEYSIGLDEAARRSAVVVTAMLESLKKH